MGNPNGRKPNNLHLEIIILRSEYNEEERKNMEKLSKDRNPENSLLQQYMQTSLSPTKLRTSLCCCDVVVLLLCEIMRRGTSYLYCFPTQNLTGADFTWGSNIILNFIIYILFFYCWLFTPRITLFFLGFR